MDTNATLDFLQEEMPIFRKYLPLVRNLDRNGNESVSESIWDIPYTISELSYLVHGHYRYYGKFPSVVAGQILEDLPLPSDDYYVLDNFCGSGTTLVEAHLRNIPAYGLDISWISALSSNVKVRRISAEKIKKLLNDIIKKFSAQLKSYQFEADNFVSKWFHFDDAMHLSLIRNLIQQLEFSNERDFLIVAFLGVIRRVSKAYDAEVRPHINKSKRRREALPAFSKKVQDMLRAHIEYMSIIDNYTNPVECFIGNNKNLGNKFQKGKCYLAISHPPYLNSFNYSPVFNLEFFWGKPFEEEYATSTIGLYKEELKAHPADEKITENYFQHLASCYNETYILQPNGGWLAVVIGDCTRNGKLIPVIDETINLVSNIGYQWRKINYRTTHYGLGKYAYRHRADYHGDNVEKRDAIIYFQK